MQTNPISVDLKSKGVLRLEAFPRSRGKFEVIGVLEKPGQEPHFASHGLLPNEAAAKSRMADVVKTMTKWAGVPFTMSHNNPGALWHRQQESLLEDAKRHVGSEAELCRLDTAARTHRISAAESEELGLPNPHRCEWTEHCPNKVVARVQSAIGDFYICARHIKQAEKNKYVHTIVPVVTNPDKAWHQKAYEDYSKIMNESSGDMQTIYAGAAGAEKLALHTYKSNPNKKWHQEELQKLCAIDSTTFNRGKLAEEMKALEAEGMSHHQIAQLLESEPLHNPVHRVYGQHPGWQWGGHGHVYPPTEAGRRLAGRQGAAAHAAGYRG